MKGNGKATEGKRQHPSAIGSAQLIGGGTEHPELPVVGLGVPGTQCSPSPASPPTIISFQQLLGLHPCGGDTEEPFPSFPRAAASPLAALTHPYSPPRTGSMTSVLAPLWKLISSQILPQCRVRRRRPRAASNHTLHQVWNQREHPELQVLLLP